ncbi:hypothetical protein ACIRD4_34925 [Streptomyces clavifer]|uniref:hypothetical protein n=1 Tax=Streptomyces clavifer TaxID=68188 RepID=UPI00381B6631
MDKNRSVEEANRTLKVLWRNGKKPDSIVLRSILLGRRDGEGSPSSLSRLVLPKGIALRFYLIAAFEAQCRLAAGGQWTNVLPLSGPGSWSDLFATDGAYNAKSATYMHDTVHGRAAEDLRLRQVQGALRTLEGLGGEQYQHALVDIPRGKRGQRLYQSFRLMRESGRGGSQSLSIYAVPKAQWQAARTVEVPAHFFLNGWAQVLSPSEVATWLAVKWLSKWARDTHLASGVYLHGERRTKLFGLRRDAWEDGCQRLRDFGLIRFARNLDEAEVLPLKADYRYIRDEEVISSRKRYEPYRYQVTDQGLEEDAVKVCKKELIFRQQQLDLAAKHRGAFGG